MKSWALAALHAWFVFVTTRPTLPHMVCHLSWDCQTQTCPAIMSQVSRLVIDLNRGEDDLGVDDTVDRHTLAHHHLHVLIELRNDLISIETQ